MARALQLVLLLGFLTAPAVPILGSPTAPGSQVTIHFGQGDLIGKAGVVDVDFNPAEYKIDKDIPWKHHRNEEEDRPTLEFTSGEPKRLSFELMFDAFEGGTTTLLTLPAALDGLVASGAPVPVTWNGRLWTSILRGAQVRTTKYDNQGNPVRVTVSTQWSDFDLVEPHEEYPFTVDIPGVPDAGVSIREIAIHPLDLREPPGPPERARFTLASPHGIPPGLLLWQQQWDAGQGIRKAITVTIFDRAKVPVRSYTLDAGGPIVLTTRHPNAAVPYTILEFTTRVGKLESINPGPPPVSPNSLAAPDAVPGELPSPLLGFLVTLDAGGIQETGAFKEVSGIKVDTEVVDYQEGGIHGTAHREHGVTKWPNLKIVGLPKWPQPVLLRWVSDAAIGQPWKATVTITPLYLFHGQPRPTRSLVLQAVTPDRYAFPDLSAVNSDGQVSESISLAPAFGVLQLLPAVQLPQGK